MFEIKWTPEAELLYLETIEYWIENNKSTTYALKIIKEVIRKEKLLAENPFLGSVILEIKEVRRILILENFSVYYRVRDNTVEVLSFWANKQDNSRLKF